MSTLDQRIMFARQRLDLAVARFRAQLNRLGNVVAGGSNFLRPALNDRERLAVASWMNSELFSDRSRTFKFNARNPATGEMGEFETSINGLMLIEPSYDSAKRRITERLARLTAEGFLSPVSVPHPFSGFAWTSGFRWDESLAAGEALNITPDSRTSSGMWAEFPFVSPIKNDHLVQPSKAWGYDRASPGVLQHFPRPSTWRRLYAGQKLFERNQRGEFVVPVEYIINELDQLTTDIVLLLKGANANVEFHPGVAAFNNGTQFPGPDYPPDISSYAWRDVEEKHRYLVDHKWAVRTNGARGSATGLVIRGKTDDLWLRSLRTRHRMVMAVNQQQPITNDWGRVDVADAIADFVRWANCASFLVDIGATSHVHACAEAHNALSIKACRELGIAVGTPADEAIAREREARGMRRAMSRVEALDQYVAALELAAARERAAAEGVAMDILNGGLVASAQLFMANPIAGAVAAVIVGCAALFAWLFGGGQAQRKKSEQCLIRDGAIRVRAKDEDDDVNGDIYGGNYYPWTRNEAIRGTPVLRAKDASGRMYE